MSPILVANSNPPPDSPILHQKSDPFVWATELPYSIHQYCTQNLTNFSQPLKYPTQFTNIATKIAPILVGTYIHHLIHQYCIQNGTELPHPMMSLPSLWSYILHSLHFCIIIRQSRDGITCHSGHLTFSDRFLTTFNH